MFFLGTSLPIYSTWAVRIHDQNITPSFSFCSPFLRPDAKRSEVELISLAKKNDAKTMDLSGKQAIQPSCKLWSRGDEVEQEVI